MIGSLRGQVQLIEGEVLLVDVGGVGYAVSCSQNTLSALEGQTEVFVWVYTHVREDQIHLFGFATPIEKQLFLSLLKVNGIGPKMALHALSATTTDNLVAMIENGDVKALTSLPKIGKKTAEQIVLSLKGKLVLASEGPVRSLSTANRREEVISALVNLGFKPLDVEKVVMTLKPEWDFERCVREGLRLMVSGPAPSLDL